MSIFAFFIIDTDLIRKLFFSLLALFLLFEGFTQCNTSFTKALEFDGSTSDYARNNTTGTDRNILRRDVTLNGGGKAQPWAFGVIFKWDGTANSDESTIWSNSNTSSGAGDKHIKLYIESGGELAFKYGKNS